ncbi:hypothetical protein [Erythrobacter ani]|uniref:Phasin domain-containing protein n=1 Tax=Erythrobacter ani TaxID=2827235 RepID=A0ABS6SLY4_9SPHN|nr:hypothetical protein [Erythrobacter ani]MBV7265502.1 hypothetical protein [Erythrobacter ani]
MRETVRRAARPVVSLAERWATLHEQAAELARHAGLAPEAISAGSEDFLAALKNAHGWQQDLVWQGVEDIDAMMQPGLSALQVIAARGQDVAAPALALWREYHLAREAVLDVIGLSRTRDAA